MERCTRRSDDGASRASGFPPAALPAPKGENRAEAQTHFDHFMKARKSKENLYTCNHSLTRIPGEDRQIEEEEEFNEFLARLDEEYKYVEEQQQTM